MRRNALGTGPFGTCDMPGANLVERGLETWRPHGLGHGEGAAGAVDQPSDEFVRFHRITMRCLSIRLVFSKLFQDAYFLIVRPVSQAVDLQCVVAVADVSCLLPAPLQDWSAFACGRQECHHSSSHCYFFCAIGSDGDGDGDGDGAAVTKFSGGSAGG
jgi:hypothetical protein